MSVERLDHSGQLASRELLNALTPKQREVMTRIDRRMPIKVIAGEMGVSETRINQHIRALKDAFDVSNLNALVEAYRSALAEGVQEDEDPYRFSQYMISQVSEPTMRDQEEVRVATVEYSPALASASPVTGSGQARKEPKVVPGALDGKNAVLNRLAVMVALSIGIVAAVVLVLTAALGVGEVLDGKASAPATSYPSAD